MSWLRAHLASHPTIVLWAAALLAAALVVAPLSAPGWLLLLDWVPGPHIPLLPPALYGLHGGLALGLPTGLTIGLLAHLIGPALNWLVLAAVFPVAMLSVARLVGRSLPERMGAALLYGVNPFVLQRLFAGQPVILLAYGILPLVVRSLVSAPDATGVRRFAPVAWMALLIAIAPQFAWISGVVLVAVVAWRRFRPRVLAWAAVVLGILGVSCVYLLVPTLGHAPAVVLPRVMLSDFATLAIPGKGLYLTTAGLYGFWRPGALGAPYVTGGWPFVLLAILLVAAGGAYSSLRDPSRRPLAVVVLSSGAAGYLLALGAQGPTGALFRFAYLHVPLFALMREAEIFAALVALAYAVCFGWGIGYLVGLARARRGKVAAVALAFVLPLGYTPTIFWGLDGTVAPSHIPRSWALADRIMGSGVAGAPAAGGPAAGGPGGGGPGKEIAGDNVQLPHLTTQSTSPRGAFLDFLVAEDHATHHLGALLAPLGVRYVALAKTVDWRSYGWLSHQVDLTRILDTRSLELWRNDVPVGLGARVRGMKSVANWSSLVALAGRPGFATTAYRVVHAGPGPVITAGASPITSGAHFVTGSARPVTPRQAASGARGTSPVRQLSATSYALPRGQGRWVELAATFHYHNNKSRS
ncbi:MAG: hypothetical protein M1522_07145 [Actinobacteria bacterium]|nr:hypothetical protein [Actinomycetota bacterium]